MYSLITGIFGFQHDISTAFEVSHNGRKRGVCMLKEHLLAQMIQRSGALLSIVSTVNPEDGYFYVPETFKTSDFRDIITCMHSFLFVRYLVHRKQPKMQNEATMSLILVIITSNPEYYRIIL
jgi:hypothetical protein